MQLLKHLWEKRQKKLLLTMVLSYVVIYLERHWKRTLKCMASIVASPALLFIHGNIKLIHGYDQIIYILLTPMSICRVYLFRSFMVVAFMT